VVTAKHKSVVVSYNSVHECLNISMKKLQCLGDQIEEDDVCDIVASMGLKRHAYRTLVGKPEWKKSLGET